MPARRARGRELFDGVLRIVAEAVRGSFEVPMPTKVVIAARETPGAR
jgi:hypothetical protein